MTSPRNMKLSNIPSWAYAFVVAMVILIGQWFINGYRIDQLEKEVDKIDGIELEMKDLENEINKLKFRHDLPNATELGVER